MSMRDNNAEHNRTPQPLQHEQLAPDQQAACVAHARALFAASLAVKQQVMETQAATIVEMAATISHALRQGGKLLLCGNGGSAADAQHLAAELLVRLRPQVNRNGLPALALATDMSSLTACGNDYSYEVYFERMTRTLGQPGDVLLGISTSGRSPNVVRALHAARETGMVALGLLGGDGGAALAACDLALVVPSHETGRIQEVHITVGHTMLELVEELLHASGHLPEASGLG
jgi:D-sedoheptulose 7-phosphate isomerase